MGLGAFGIRHGVVDFKIAVTAGSYVNNTIFQEGFEATSAYGYDVSGWVAYPQWTGDYVSSNYTGIARPTGGGNQCLVIKSGPSYDDNYINVLNPSLNLTSNTAYLTFCFKVGDGSIGHLADLMGTRPKIMYLDTSVGGSRIFQSILYKTDAPNNKTHLLLECYNGSDNITIPIQSQYPTPEASALDHTKWYRVYFKYDITNSKYAYRIAEDGGSIINLANGDLYTNAPKMFRTIRMETGWGTDVSIYYDNIILADASFKTTLS